jgi:hypothetical protein
MATGVDGGIRIIGFLDGPDISEKSIETCPRPSKA